MFDTDFEEIEPPKLVSASMAGSGAATLASTIVPLVRSNGEGLCHPKKRKRLELVSVVERLAALLDAGSDGGGAVDVADAPAATRNIWRSSMTA